MNTEITPYVLSRLLTTEHSQYLGVNQHTFGSRLGMKGMDLKTIMQIMDRKTTAMLLGTSTPLMVRRRWPQWPWIKNMEPSLAERTVLTLVRSNS